MNSLLLFAVCTSRALWGLEWLIDNACLSSPLPFSDSPSAFRREVAKMNGAVGPIIWATVRTLQTIRPIRDGRGGWGGCWRAKNGLRSSCPCEGLLFHPGS